MSAILNVMLCSTLCNVTSIFYWYGKNKVLHWNSSDGRVVRATASVAVDLDLIPCRVKPTTFKLVFTASLIDIQHSGTAWNESRQVDLLCRWERHLARLPHLGVVGRWLATPKHGHIEH